MANTLSKRWTRQPSYNVPIDKSHPLAQGLVSFVYPNNTPIVRGGLRRNVDGKSVFWCDGNGVNSRVIIPVPPIRMNGVTIAVFGRYDDDFIAAAAVAALSGASDSSSNSSFGFAASIYNASELFGIDSSVYGTDRISSLSNPQTPGFYACRKFNGTNTASVFYNNTSYPVSLDAPGTTSFVYSTLKLFVKGNNNVDPPNNGSWTEYVAVWNRSLSNAELAAFRANPWQVLKPRDDFFLYMGASSGVARSQVETATATDSQETSVVRSASISESATATDAQSATGVYNVASSESVAAADSQSAISSKLADQTEATTATDSQSTGAVIAASLSEAATATDTQSAIKTTLSSQSENVAVTDSQSSAGSGSNAVQTEGATVTDSQSEISSVGAIQSEAVVAIDAYIAQSIKVAMQSDSVSSSDVQAAILVVQSLISESIIAVDYQSSSGSSASASQADAINPIDMQSATKNVAIMAAITENITAEAYTTAFTRLGIDPKYIVKAIARILNVSAESRTYTVKDDR